MTSGNKKFIFLVQGEGRGHMTQAISLFQILTKNGHEVPHIFIGKSQRRKIPGYLLEAVNVPVEPLNSPNFISDSKNKSIRLIPSILYNSRYLKTYNRSLRRIDEVVKKVKPDVLINFYDFLGGFYNFLYRPSLKFIPVGHQFMTDHPNFTFAKGRLFHKRLFLINNYLNSIGAFKKLALSFTPNYPPKVKNTIIVPPLLRHQLLELKSTDHDFILGYMVNDGYSQEIIDWSLKNPDIKLEIFWDKRNEPDTKKVGDNLIFHQLDAEKFLQKMTQCKGMVTTAGFESVCECMYLGKPVLMVPVSGQYEQACNALDAERAGAGIQAESFNISRLIQYIPYYKNPSDSFRSWLGKGEEIILRELTDF
jgi:uncharacterized protein (TIGR00661 family)